MKKYKRVAVGGTFDKFHYGHRSLIAKAFEIGENVEIGVTSNQFVESKEGDIDSCNIRMANLNEFLDKQYDNFHISRQNRQGASRNGCFFYMPARLAELPADRLFEDGGNQKKRFINIP
jgi:cytidyltransferase-like protein